MYEVLYLAHEAGQKNTTTKNSKYAKQQFDIMNIFELYILFCQFICKNQDEEKNTEKLNFEK